MSLRQISTTLGLSVTTVSRALAGYDDVADETRRRVREEADRIGYAPNAIARRLQKGRTDAFAVVASVENTGPTDTFLVEAVSSAWSRLVEIDRDLILLATGLDHSRDHSDRGPFKRTVIERRVDGVLLVRPRCSDWQVDFLLERHLPFVVIGASLPDRPEAISVATDEDQGGRLIVERLAATGHRHMVCVAPPTDYDFVRARLAALARHGAAAGITLEVHHGGLSEEEGYRVTRGILDATPLPTALVFLINRMAHGGLTAVRETRIVPGRDIALITWGDDPILEHTSPPMTAVRLPIRDMVRHAVDVLAAKSAGQPVELIPVWPVELVVRGSDGPCPDRGRDGTTGHG